MAEIFQLLGVAGTIIVACAYVPQIWHLAKEHCSAGVSVKAWLLWLLASILIFSHALNVYDIVFITLQIINMASIVLTIILAKRYKLMVCASHELPNVHEKHVRNS